MRIIDIGPFSTMDDIYIGPLSTVDQNIGPLSTVDQIDIRQHSVNITHIGIGIIGALPYCKIYWFTFY